jgi:hypothetical protein
MRHARPRHAPPNRRAPDPIDGRTRALAATLTLVATTALAVVIAPGGVHKPVPGPTHRAAGPAPATVVDPPPLIDPTRPVGTSPHILGWAVVDAVTGRVLGQHGGATTTLSASIVKVWLAADVMHRADDDPNQDLVDDASDALVDSDNAAATRLYRAGGGRDGLFRMVHTCELGATLPHDSRWGETIMSAVDIAKLGACVARGRAAGPTWTTWVLDQMRAARGTGRFGPHVTLPPATDVALKNGWSIVGGHWLVNCLAIIDLNWSLGIATRYPAHLGLDYGATLCAAVTRQLAALPGPVASTHLT